MNSPAVYVNSNGTTRVAFDADESSYLSFQSDQADLAAKWQKAYPNVFVVLGESNAFITPMPNEVLDWKGDPRRFYTVNGMLVGQLLAQMALAPGKLGNNNGSPSWIPNAPTPKPDPQPASGAGLIPEQDANKTVFGGDINATPGSIADKVAAVQASLSDLASALRTKGDI